MAEEKVYRTPEEDNELLALAKETGKNNLLELLTPEGKAAKKKFDALPQDERARKLARIEELRAKAGKGVWDLLKERRDER